MSALASFPCFGCTGTWSPPKLASISTPRKRGTWPISSWGKLRSRFEQKTGLIWPFPFRRAAVPRQYYTQRGRRISRCARSPRRSRRSNPSGLPPAVENGRQPPGSHSGDGTTGSEKSTTLAAIVDQINVTRKAHILTIEDPIEFVHKNKNPS